MSFHPWEHLLVNLILIAVFLVTNLLWYYVGFKEGSSQVKQSYAKTEGSDETG